MYDIIIVGAGPAGLTSAIYGCRAAKKVLVLEAKSYGGQIINAFDIENYPACAHISGFDLATSMYNQVKDLGGEIKFEKVNSITKKDGSFQVVTAESEYVAKSVILATGAKSKKLDIDNEDKFIGSGVSYCATCDGAFFKGLDVAVLGGGNTALGEALYLSNICKMVYLIYRKDRFKGEEGTIRKLEEKENVKFIFNSVITRLIGEDKVEAIEISNGEEKTKIKVSGVFVAVGHEPENELFKDMITLDKEGYIEAKEDCRTNIAGIFVAGDIRSKDVRQLVTAVADGAVAANAAVKYINKH